MWDMRTTPKSENIYSKKGSFSQNLVQICQNPVEKRERVDLKRDRLY